MAVLFANTFRSRQQNSTSHSMKQSLPKPNSTRAFGFSIAFSLALAFTFCLVGTTRLVAAPPLAPDEPVLIPDSQGKFDFIQVDQKTSRLLVTHTGNKTLDIFDSS